MPSATSTPRRRASIICHALQAYVRPGLPNPIPNRMGPVLGLSQPISLPQVALSFDPSGPYHYTQAALLFGPSGTIFCL
jgi:hypothetical protein